MRRIARGGAWVHLIGGLWIVSAACVGTVDPGAGEEGADDANMTPNEPVGEVQQALTLCECSTAEDWCRWGRHCSTGYPCTPSTSCGLSLGKVCNGMCIAD